MNNDAYEKDQVILCEDDSRAVRGLDIEEARALRRLVRGS